MCESFTGDRNDDHAVKFENIATERLIEHFGSVGPLHSRRPRKEVMDLLMAGAGEYSFPRMWAFKYYGLVYITGCIVGRKATRCRLTIAGLALLDHWAAKNKKFAPFVKAFVSTKARKEIATDCCAFVLGAEPPSLEHNRVIHERELAKLMEMEKRVSLFRERKDAYRKAASQKKNLFWLQQQQQTNLNTWSSSLGLQGPVVTSNGLVGMVPQTISSGSTITNSAIHPIQQTYDPNTQKTTILFSNGTAQTF